MGRSDSLILKHPLPRKAMFIKSAESCRVENVLSPRFADKRIRKNVAKTQRKLGSFSLFPAWKRIIFLEPHVILREKETEGKKSHP